MNRQTILSILESYETTLDNGQNVIVTDGGNKEAIVEAILMKDNPQQNLYYETYKHSGDTLIELILGNKIIDEDGFIHERK